MTFPSLCPNNKGLGNSRDTHYNSGKDDLPFRWSLENRTSLGALIDGTFPPLDPAFLHELTRCCARIVAFSEDSELCFVGRSPEHCFDYLSGLLFDSTWADRLHLLHFSLRYAYPNIHHQAWSALRAYFTSVGLDPKHLIRRMRPVTFVDLVASGGTCGNIVQFLQRWTKVWGEDWNEVKRKIRLPGITMQGKTSPNTWRWHQHAHWVTLVDRQAMKNISTPWWFWDQFGNQQAKVTRSYTADRWGSTDANNPRTNLGNAKALKRAVQLFDLGKTKESRQSFTRHLSEEKAMAYPWLRALILELRSR